MASWTIQNVPALCITLERRADRWKRFQDQPGIDGLKVQRFNGIDGQKLDLDKDERITTLTKRNIRGKSRRSHEELDSIGGVGCALSHIAAWQWMVDNQQEICIIFEDDAVVPKTFISRANECIQKSQVLRDPKRWDMWLLGGKWDNLSRIPIEPDSTGVVRVGAFVLFHAYVLTLHGARRMLKDAYPIHAHIDVWASIYAYMNNMRIVGCTDLMLKQNPKVKTDIQSEEGCLICNVPTDYDKSYELVKKMDWQIAQASKVVCVSLIAFIIYQNIKS
jgi:GR25 family glycosyltransferase involved in LPS biosynthesis